MRPRLFVSAQTKFGLARLLRRSREVGQRLENEGFLERVRAAQTGAKGPDEGVHALALKARADDMAGLKEKAKVRRQPVGSKKTYDDEAVEKMAAAPESQVLVPQRATGKVNLAATGAVGMGVAITKEWLARECEARGIELPRAKKGEHAGEVPSTVTMDVMKRKIPEHAGGSLAEFVTDEDGDVKGVYDWLGSGGGGCGGGGGGGGGCGNRGARGAAAEAPGRGSARLRDVAHLFNA